MTKIAKLSSKCSKTQEMSVFAYFESGKAGNVSFELKIPKMPGMIFFHPKSSKMSENVGIDQKCIVCAHKRRERPERIKYTPE